jgi:hypothetical protein
MQAVDGHREARLLVGTQRTGRLDSRYFVDSGDVERLQSA